MVMPKVAPCTLKASEAMNHLFRAATAAYFVDIDIDDMLDVDYIEILEESLFS